MKNTRDTSVGCSCGCFPLICIAIFNLVFGTIAVQYLCETWLHKPIAFGWAMLIGLIAGEITVPAAIITWILQQAGAI